MLFNQNTMETIMALMMVFFIVFVEPIYKTITRVMKPIIIITYLVGVGVKTRYQEWSRKVPYSEYILLQQRMIE